MRLPDFLNGDENIRAACISTVSLPACSLWKPGPLERERQARQGITDLGAFSATRMETSPRQIQRTLVKDSPKESLSTSFSLVTFLRAYSSLSF